MPSPAALRLIRGYIASHAGELREILRSPKFKQLYGVLQGEQLLRAPKGFSPDDPALDLLRYKQFVVWLERPAAFAETTDLFPFLIEAFVTLIPFVRYLNRGLKT